MQMNEFLEGHVKVPSWEFVHFAHCQKLLACQGTLKRKAFSSHKYLLKTFHFHNVNCQADGVEAIASFSAVK